MHNEDFWLFALIFLVWGIFAVLYAAVEMFTMPGSAQVWGAGSVIFFALSLLLMIAAKRRR